MSNMIPALRDPTVADKSPGSNVHNGDIWYNSVTNIAFICEDAGTGEWSQINNESLIPANTQTITADDTIIVSNAASQIDLTITGSTLLECDTISAGSANGQRVMVRMVSVDETVGGSLQLNPGGNLSLQRDIPWCANSVDRWIEFAYDSASAMWVELRRDFLSKPPEFTVPSYVDDDDLIEIQPCDSVINFTETNGVLSLDTDNVFCSVGSIKITPDNVGTGVVLGGLFAGQPINVGAAGFIEVRFKLLAGAGLADPNTYLANINFALLDSTFDGNKRRIWTSGLWTDGTGWWFIRLPYSAINTVVTAGDGLTTTALRQFYFEFILTDASATCEMVLDRIAFVSASPLTTGYYVVRIDSSESYGKLLCNYAASKGIRVALCVDPKLIGRTGFLARSDLIDIQSMGHEIGMYHGDWPNVTWNLKTEYQKEGMIEFAKWFAQDLGLDEVSSSVVHIPGGTGWQPSDTAKFGSRYAMATGGYRGETIFGLLNAPWTPDYLHWTYFIDGAAVTKDASFGSWVTQCVTEKSIFMLGSHANDAAERTVFESCIDDLVASTLRPCTFGDILQGKLI